MIHQHLQRRALVATPMLSDAHLDEDSLSAFIEGRLGETESAPIISHLVACAFCRRITTQLVRLDSEIGAGETMPHATANEPGRIRRLLADLASRVLPSTEGDAVLAYHAPAEDFRRKGETDSDKEPASEENDPERPPGESHSNSQE
ncbi:MAG TPA: hypothetical protein VD966_00020 [Pyrinomonadaceae bacterium]|nr:hypothetical protein [Pyrinomonadaceae bacterium]